jgi:hypothetical protein
VALFGHDPVNKPVAAPPSLSGSNNSSSLSLSAAGPPQRSVSTPELPAAALAGSAVDRADGAPASMSHAPSMQSFGRFSAAPTPAVTAQGVDVLCKAANRTQAIGSGAGRQRG